jgi:DnaK suppressor protein
MESGEVPGIGATCDGSGDHVAAAAPAVAAGRILSARAAAEARAAALSVQIEGLAEQQALTTHDDEHDPEGVTIGFERAQLLGLLAGARREMSALDRATARLRAGTYGRCLNCGNAIPDARLEALPAAEICLNCSTQSRRRR